MRFGHQASISATSASFLDGQFITDEQKTVYRYILCHDNDVVYFSPTTRQTSSWRVPDKDPDWLYIDRSATITPDIAAEISSYLMLAPNVKLAIFITKHSNQSAAHVDSLISRADLVIADTVLRKPRENVAYITKKYIEYNGQRVSWSMKQKSDFITKGRNRSCYHLNS